MVTPAQYHHIPSTGLGQTSLYSILPPIPTLLPHRETYKIGNVAAREIARMVEENGGATQEIYESLLEERIELVEKRSKLEQGRKRRKLAKDGGGMEEIKDGEEKLNYVNLNKGKGRAKNQDNMDSDDEEEEIGHSSVNKKSKGRNYKSKRPKIEIPQVDLPSDYPSGSLLSAIHNRASHLLASKHLLLPELTPECPHLPPEIIEHINSLRTELENIEAAKVVDVTARSKYRFTEWKHRVRANKTGWQDEENGKIIKSFSRAKGWRDVEKRWEGSALVAIGMFTQLLTSHLLGDLTTNPRESEELAAERAELVAQGEAEELILFEHGLEKVEQERIASLEKNQEGKKKKESRAESRKQNRDEKSNRKVEKHPSLEPETEEESSTRSESPRHKRLASFDKMNESTPIDVEPPLDSDRTGQEEDSSEQEELTEEDGRNGGEEEDGVSEGDFEEEGSEEGA